MQDGLQGKKELKGLKGWPVSLLAACETLQETEICSKF